MLNSKFSPLYIRIIAYLLCVVLFSGAILIFISSWFFREYEDTFLEQNREIVDAVNEQVAGNMQSVYDVCAMIMDNQIVKNNLRPYDALTNDQLYNYNSILSLLQQARLQFNGIIDSIFLYTDDQRVLYAQKLSGMAAFDVFFNKFTKYDSYQEDFWQEILKNNGVNLTVLVPDICSSLYVNDTKAVVPLIYTSPRGTSTHVLTINIALNRILDQFELKSMYPDTLYAVCGSNGVPIIGSPRLQALAQLSDGERAHIDQQDYYVFTAVQKALGVQIYILVPTSALANLTAYYRTVIIFLLAVLILFGGVLSIIMSKRVYEPIRIVREDIQNLPVDVPSASINNEIELIRDTLSKLIDERELYKSRDQQHSFAYITQSIAMLLDRQPLNEKSYLNLLLTRDYGFSGSGYRCADIIVDLEEEENYLLRAGLIDQVREQIVSALYGILPVLCFTYQGNMLILLADSNDQDEALLRTTLKKVEQQFINSCTLRIGIGPVVQELQEIAASFDQANTEVFTMQPGNELLEISHREIFSYDPAEIRNAVYIGDIKTIEEASRSILTQAKQCKIAYRDAVYIIKDICKAVIEIQRKSSNIQPAFLPRMEEVNALEVLILSPEINISPLMVAILPYISEKTNDTEKSSDKIPVQIKEYIDTHYSEEMSLDILADKVGISSKYLSRVFKQAMGVNLSDYLTYVRVEKIKAMLLTDMTLNQISEQVGIFNRTTFTRMFKRLEGVTPSEYRSLHKPL